MLYFQCAFAPLKVRSPAAFPLELAPFLLKGRFATFGNLQIPSKRYAISVSVSTLSLRRADDEAN